MIRTVCNCPPCRGQLINRRAYIGSQLVFLRDRIIELEKLARKTPPRTLLAEIAKVERAKVSLIEIRNLQAQLSTEYAHLISTE